MGYDYTHYRSQIDKKQFPILPAITIVLNFSDKPWNKTKTIYDIMEIPDEFKPYVQDYKVEVFDIAFWEDDVIELFTSDFKLVAKFFKYKRLGKYDFLENEAIKHVQEFIDFLKVFTDDDRYNDIKQKILEMQKNGRSITLCTIAQTFEDRGIEKGLKKGIEKGIEKGIKQERINRIQIMIKKGKSKEEILDWDYTEEEYAEAEHKLLQLM